MMPGKIVRTREGMIGVIESVQNGKYVIRCSDGTHDTDKIRRATFDEMEKLCKTLLTKEPR